MNSNSIYCPKCGTENSMDTKFCAGCGNQIQNSNPTPNVEQQQEINVNQNVIDSSINHFKYLISSILKPHSEYKKNEKALENIKNSTILSVIVVVATVIINLITTMFNAVRIKSFWTNEIEWVWENLKEIQYLKVIGQSILMYTLVLCAIAGVYFLASLVIKKDVKFPKLLGIVTTAFLPIMICTTILSPIISLIYSPLGICVNIIGVIYGILILIELINDVIVIDNKDTKIYFHLTCLSIIVIGIVIIVYNMFLSSLGSIFG